MSYIPTPNPILFAFIRLLTNKTLPCQVFRRLRSFLAMIRHVGFRVIAKNFSRQPPRHLGLSKYLGSSRNLISGTTSEKPLAPHLSACDVQYPGAYLAVRNMTLPKDENFMGDIFGGYILSEMDIAAAICARRHCKSRVVTVAVDRLVFKRPVYTGDTISCYTWIKSVGRSSMNIRVLVVSKRMSKHVGESDVIEEVTEGLFTMVAKDEDGNTMRVPPLEVFE